MTNSDRSQARPEGSSISCEGLCCRPRVSVCLMTFNHQLFIAQAVDSALTQEAKFEYEVVISCDCSTDGTRSIIEGLAGGGEDTAAASMIAVAWHMRGLWRSLTVSSHSRF